VDVVPLTLVPNEPLAEMLCEQIRSNGIPAFHKAASPFGGSTAPTQRREVWVSEADAERARTLLPD
jgi:Putative prokaryotic signal transducing protein